MINRKADISMRIPQFMPRAFFKACLWQRDLRQTSSCTHSVIPLYYRSSNKLQKDKTVFASSQNLQTILEKQNWTYCFYSLPEQIQFFTTCSCMAGDQPLFRVNLLRINKRKYYCHSGTILSVYLFCSCYKNSMKMEEERLPSPRPQPPLLFASRIFRFNAPASGKLSIYFYEEQEGLCFTCEQILQRINFKTVVAGLSGNDAGAVTAQLVRQGSNEYSLVVRVEEEFLMPIEEVLTFVGKKMTQKELEKVSIRREGKVRVEKLREQVLQFTGQCFQRGSKIAENGSISLTLPIPFATTIYSFDLSFQKLQYHIVFIEFYYLDSKKRLVKVDTMPKEGLYVMGQAEICHLAERTKYKQITMIVRGNYEELKYLVKYERVQGDSYKNAEKVKKWLIMLSVLVMALLIAVLIRPSSAETPSL